MNQFLYQLRPTRPGMVTDGPTEEELAVLDRHSAYLEDLAKRQIVLLAGRTQNPDPSTFGIVIFLAETPEQAEQIMNSDPGVSGKVFLAEIFPYRIAFSSGIAPT